MYDADCDEIDDFIASHKSLVEFKPPWSPQFAGLHQCRWGIADIHGVETAELCFTVSPNGAHQSIVCLHRQRLIYRLDVAPPGECKDNWHTAQALGLPPVVCGTHVHGWPENREYVRCSGFGRMPVRRPITAIVQDLTQALHWLAEDLNIQINPGQRDFEMPERTLI